jgi:flagellar hook-length control protein FliK
VDVKISRGGRPDADDSTAAAHELPEADVDASETSADVDGTDRRRGVLPVHQTTSVERAGRPSQSPRAAEQAGERSAASTAVSADAVEQEPAANADEPDRELSAAKNPDESNDPRRPDEATADNRPQSARPRPIAGPRGLAAQSAAAASAELNLSNAAAASPTDAASEREANRTATVTKDSLLSTFDRFDRHNSLANRGVHRGDGGQETPHVDPARFVSRVARAIHTAQERGGPLQLRLSPPELGSLRLEIAVRQGVLTASVETETTTARQLLLENLPVLRDRLAEQNVRIERFDVDVRRDGGEQPRFGPQHQDHQPPRHTATQNRGGQQHGPGGNDAPAEPAPRRTITDTSINVIA